jgi:adenylate cyclase
MTAQIFAFGGTVEKYIGDEILAVFGVPTVSDDDASTSMSGSASITLSAASP